MSVVKVWIHAVWATKGRYPFLHDRIRSQVFSHIVQNARYKKISIDRINGYADHVHVLFTLRSTQRLAEVIHLLKGESSRWINRNQLTEEPFEWQTDYWAVSVCESTLASVRKYIDRQENHHRLRS